MIVGIDVGTSALKAAVFLQDSNKADYYSFPYPGDIYTSPGVVSAKHYERLLDKAIHKISQQGEITHIAITTQMYSILKVVDDEIFVFQWNSLWDLPPNDLAQNLRYSGCPIDSIYGGYKLATVSAEERKKFLPYGLKEHLFKHITGEMASDYCTASASGLFNLAKGNWNFGFLAQLGYNKNTMPKLYSHDQAIGTLKGGKTVVVAGMGDGPSASFASKDISNLCGNLGTSMALRGFTKRSEYEPDSSLWTYMIDEETNVTGGISPNACSVFTWAESCGLNTDGKIYDTKDIRFFPWLHGERMPYWSDKPAGTFTGIKISSTKEQLGCAVLKSVAFTFATIAQKLIGRSQSNAVVLAGGATNIPALLDIIAGCIDNDLVLVEGADYMSATGALLSACQYAKVSYKPNMDIVKVIHPHNQFKEEFIYWRELADKLAITYEN